MDRYSYGGGSSSYGGSSGLSGAPPPPQKPSSEQIKRQVATQIQMQQLQEMVQKIQGTCFDKCISKPGDSLGNYEKKCLGNCMDRYMEAFQLVARVAQAHSQRALGGSM